MDSSRSHRKSSTAVPSQQSFFRTRQSSESESTTAFFQKPAAPQIQRQASHDFIIQRQEDAAPANTEKAEEEKDPIAEGLKTTGGQLLKNPQFKLWYEPKLDLLKDTLWASRPLEEKVAIISWGALTLGTAGFAFSQNPEFRELLSGVNIGTPLGWIPYSPIKGFSYKLPSEGKPNYGFSTEFTLDPYLELLSKRYPKNPWTGASFGLDTRYTPDKGLSVTGGKFDLDFLGGGLTAEGKTFNELSPYPQFIPGDLTGSSPSTLMQSVPGLPPIQTGPGFQFMLKLDFAKLLNRMEGKK